MKRALPITLAVLLVAAGCGPSQEELDTALAQVRELQGQLEQARSDRSEMEEQLQRLTTRNEEMVQRLRALGQNVEDLEGQRGDLQESLAETRRALNELQVREQQAQARLATFRQLLERFRSMIESGRLRVRIVRNRMVVELPEGILFDSGRAEIKREGTYALVEVAAVLRDLQGRDFQVAGHTDNIPIRTRRFPSNWILSTNRAVAVAQFLIEQGVPAEHISAAGYSDTQPVATNETPEGRAQNRRIDIVLLPNLDELPDLSSLASEEEGASGREGEASGSPEASESAPADGSSTAADPAPSEPAEDASGAH